MKQREALNILKTAHRLEAVTTQIKANENNIAVFLLNYKSYLIIIDDQPTKEFDSFITTTS